MVATDRPRPGTEHFGDSTHGVCRRKLLKVKDADDSTYSATVPSKIGDYTVKAIVAETTNYKSGVATADFTISKAALTVTAKNQSITVGDNVPDLSNPVLDTHYTVTGLVGSDTLTTVLTLSYQNIISILKLDSVVLQSCKMGI